jgi:hypothetical protein
LYAKLSWSSSRIDRMRGCERVMPPTLGIGVECCVGATMVRRECIVQLSLQQLELPTCPRSELASANHTMCWRGNVHINKQA